MKKAARFPVAVAAFSATAAASTFLASPASAHEIGFKSPGPGMHFTQGQPIVIFADIFDSRDGKGIIACPPGQTVSNTTPPPDYSDPPRPAQCSGGGTPTGWPAFQVKIDGAVQTDLNTNLDTVPNTTAFDHNINPSPIAFFRFNASSAGLAPGPHQIVVHALFSADGIAITPQDGDPLTIYIDAPPAKSMMMLTANVTGNVSWDNVIVVGNGHTVNASGSLVIKNSLVTGLGDMKTAGLTGSVSDADIEGSIFEDTGAVSLTLGNGNVTIKNNEFRANNRLTFVAWDPSVPIMLDFRGAGANAKQFQGNRVGAGQSSFGGQNWLIGGDSDAESNVLIGPRTMLDVFSSKTVIRGNFSHHNYRGAWSQGFNFYYEKAGSEVLTEHNFIRDSSWPVQYLAGEFRYNVVYGYGHNWVRTTKSNAAIHHNIFAPGGDGGLNSGIQCYGGETGLQIYNNTFDGGGNALGDFAGATIDMSGGSQVVSLRNNLVTFSRNNQNSPGSIRITGGASSYLYADYNAFYSPDNTTKTNYDFVGMGTHDVSGAGALGVVDGQLSATPFAGARVLTDGNRIIDSVIDEAAVWQGTQKVSQVLALFRDRYTPKAGSPIIDTGDPNDNDSQGRRADIGAVDLAGHDQDRIGKFGTPPSELVPPTVSLTAPTANAVLTGNAALAAMADDNPGGSGVVLVQFLVDGSTVAQTATSPHAASFNSAIVANGQHAFSAKAWDAAGNVGFSAVVMATTMNTVTIPDGGTGGSGTGGGSNGATGATGGASNGATGTTSAGTNGGTSTTNGGAASSGGTPSTSGGSTAGANGGAASPPAKSGCGCSVPGGANPRGGAVMVPLGALLGMALRRARRRARLRTHAACLALLALGACSGNESDSTGQAATSGGTSGGGSAGSSASGGATTTGGTVTTTGGTVTATGGTVTTTGGTVTSTGGAVTATGGTVTATGGTVTATGGTVTATGGTVTATGGTVTATGGTATSTGGAVTSTGSTGARGTGTGGTVSTSGAGGDGGTPADGGGGGDGGSGTGCTRDLLKSTVDAYFKALAAHSASTLPLASNVKFTENGKVLTIGSAGLWKTAGTLKYAHTALDADGCNAASEAVVPDGTMDIPYALRLKLQNQKITEIETIAVHPGDYSVASNTAAISASATTVKWEDPVLANQRNTQAEITAWMDKYFKIFPRGVCNTATGCTRLENGGGSYACSAGASCVAGPPAAGTPAIVSHIIFADVETGIGVGFDLFMGNADMHMFKMYGGQIYAVHAILGAATSTGWD